MTDPLRRDGDDESPRDLEGEALDAEIAADLRAGREDRRRRVLYVPPLLALVLAAVALALAHPHDVFGARVVVGGTPPAGVALHARVLVIGAPGADETATSPTEGMELRVSGEGVRGRAETTNEDGAAEVVVEAPLPARIDLEGKIGAAWAKLATIALDSVPPADPSDGVIDAKRTYGQATGDLLVDVSPELGALVPQEQGAAWARVRRKTTGEPIAGATVELRGEAGLVDDPVAATTNDAGLARIVLTPSAPPVVVVVRAKKEAIVGEWRGALGTVLGVPAPHAARVRPEDGGVELVAAPTIRAAYYEVWREGVRIDGGRVAFVQGSAKVPLPKTPGLFDVEVSTGPNPGSEDLVHDVAWPIVVAGDAMDAWAQLVAPRIPERLSPPLGAVSTYESCVAATIARAPVASPHRALIADGLPAALEREHARVRRVRRGAAFAILGGGLAELGLMLGLGVFGGRKRIDEELRTLAEEGEEKEEGQEPPASRPGHGGASRASPAFGGLVRTTAIVVTAVGIIALVFAALAVMAWGLPS